MYFMIMFGGGSHHTRSGAILSLLNVLHGGVAGRCVVGVGVLLWYSLCDTVFSNSGSRGRCAYHVNTHTESFLNCNYISTSCCGYICRHVIFRK